MGSSTPMETPAELWAEIHRLRATIKGPDGFDTWQDAAVSERLKRVELESEAARLRKALEEARSDERLKIAQSYVLVPHASWNWLMGLGESFEPPADTPKILNAVPKFWWRTELQKRIQADGAALSQERR